MKIAKHFECISWHPSYWGEKKWEGKGDYDSYGYDEDKHAKGGKGKGKNGYDSYVPKKNLRKEDYNKLKRNAQGQGRN